MSIAEKLTAIAENVSKVYEAGQNAEYDRFWNGYQEDGNRRNYDYAFRGSGWTDETYKPKYPIIAIGSLEAAYRQCKITRLTNIETSGVTSFSTTFYLNSIAIYDKLDFSKATNTQNAFAHSTAVHTIVELVSSDVTVWATNTFQNCYNLENLNITGTIATNFTFSSSGITHDSLISIINALKDYSAEGGTHTCTIGSTNLGKLTDTEKAIATEKGWTLA